MKTNEDDYVVLPVDIVNEADEADDIQNDDEITVLCDGQEQGDSILLTVTGVEDMKTKKGKKGKCSRGNSGLSKNDEAIEKILDNEKPVVTIPYKEVLDVLMNHARCKYDLPKSNSIIRINNSNGQCEIYPVSKTQGEAVESLPETETLYELL